MKLMELINIQNAIGLFKNPCSIVSFTKILAAYKSALQVCPTFGVASFVGVSDF
jgi:hypothetical protein